MKKILTVFIGVGLFFVSIELSLAEKLADVDLSLKLASSKSLRQLAPEVREVWIYEILERSEMKVPLNYKKRKPDLILSDSVIPHFINALEAIESRPRNYPGERKIKTRFAHLAIFIFIGKNPATLPAYLWIDVFLDGRAYVEYYSGRDSVGRFNPILLDFISERLP